MRCAPGRPWRAPHCPLRDSCLEAAILWRTACQLGAVTRATGNQWPQTCIATRKVDALLSRVACTRRPKAFNAALLATGRVDVLHARAAGAQWPKTCIALAGAAPARRPRSALAAFRGGLITTTNGAVLAVHRHHLQAAKRALQAAKR